MAVYKGTPSLLSTNHIFSSSSSPPPPAQNCVLPSQVCSALHRACKYSQPWPSHLPGLKSFARLAVNMRQLGLVCSNFTWDCKAPTSNCSLNRPIGHFLASFRSLIREKALSSKRLLSLGTNLKKKNMIWTKLRFFFI